MSSSAVPPSSSATTTTITSNSTDHEFTVAVPDVLRLILAYLTSQNLHESARMLRQESGVGLQGFLHPTTVATHVRQGDWGNVLKAVQLSQFAHESLHEQLILELAAETDSRDEYNRDTSSSNTTNEALTLAYGVLKVHRDELDQIMEPLITNTEGNAENEDREISKARNLEQKLAALAGDPDRYATARDRHTFLFGSRAARGGGALSILQERRNVLAQDIEASQSQIPMTRLPVLLQQAIKWQSHTGQLPWIKEAITSRQSSSKKKQKRQRKRKHFDLVRGVASGDVAAVVGEPVDEEENNDDEMAEPIPQETLTKVKFGKGVVCESAVLFQKGLITGSSDGLIEVWDGTNFDDLNTTDYAFQKDAVMGHKDSRVLCLSLANDNELLASGDGQGVVKIWKMATGKCLRQFEAHSRQSVTCLTFSKDASRVLTGSADGTCREFGLVTQHILQEYNGHTSYVHCCDYVLDGDSMYVLTSSADGTVRLWQHGSSIRIFQPKQNIDRRQRTGLVKSLVVDQTSLANESPAVHSIVPIPGNSREFILVPRSSTAFRIDLDGNVLQQFLADADETEFLAATVTPSWVFLCTNKDCLVFSLSKGTLHTTIRDFAPNSIGKTSGSTTACPEISAIVHHPYKSLLATFSNSPLQKKGALTVWKSLSQL